MTQGATQSLADNSMNDSVIDSGCLLENLAPNQHAANFAGSRSNLVELGVTEQPAGREVVNVAVATEALDGLQSGPCRPFGGIEDGAGGILTGGFPFVAGPGHRIDVGLGGIHRDVHVGDLGLHDLESANWLAELLAVV